MSRKLALCLVTVCALSAGAATAASPAPPGPGQQPPMNGIAKALGIPAATMQSCMPKMQPGQDGPAPRKPEPPKGEKPPEADGPPPGQQELLACLQKAKPDLTSADLEKAMHEQMPQRPK